MTKQRQLSSSLLFVALTLTAPALATTDPLADTVELDTFGWRLDQDFSAKTIFYAPEIRFLDAVTMRHFPSGSLVVQYEGPQRLLIHHAKSQVRRLGRKYGRTYENQDRLREWETEPRPSDWWGRRWFESLPSDQGGAPDKPYIHVVGSEIDWKFGPLTISNTFKLKLDYVAVLSLNTDPISPSSHNPQPISVDVSPTGGADLGTTVRFKFKPNVRLGLSQDGSIIGFLRKLSVRASFDVILRGSRFLSGDIEFSFDPEDGVSLSFEVSFAEW